VPVAINIKVSHRKKDGNFTSVESTPGAQLIAEEEFHSHFIIGQILVSEIN
jgi:hypothetical protein